jgi:hypothetical protein
MTCLKRLQKVKQVVEECEAVITHFPFVFIFQEGIRKERKIKNEVKRQEPTTMVVELVCGGVHECRLAVLCIRDRPREATSWGPPAQLPIPPSLPPTHSEELTSPLHACSFAYQATTHQSLTRKENDSPKASNIDYSHARSTTRRPTFRPPRPTRSSSSAQPTTRTTTLRRAVGVLRLRCPTYPPLRPTCSPDTNKTREQDATRRATFPTGPIFFASKLRGTRTHSTSASPCVCVCVCGACACAILKKTFVA